MEGKKNLCAMIPAELHARIMAEKEEMKLGRMQQKLGIRMCKAVCRTVKCTVFDNLTAAHHHHTVCKI